MTSHHYMSEIQKQCAVVQNNLTIVSDLIDQILYQTSTLLTTNPSITITTHIDTLYTNFNHCGDNIESLEEQIQQLTNTLLSQPTLFSPQHYSRTTTLTGIQDDNNNQHVYDVNLLHDALHALISQYELLDAKIIANKTRLDELKGFEPNLYQEQLQQQQQQQTSKRQQFPSQSIHPNLSPLLQMPSLSMPFTTSNNNNKNNQIDNDDDMNEDLTTMKNRSKLTTKSHNSLTRQQFDQSKSTLTTTNPNHTKSKTQINDRLQQKKTFTSTIMQQQILDSLERSRNTLGENVQQTESSYDTLMISNEMLQVINQDATTAQMSSTLSANLTTKHERKALVEKKMVRWSFILFMLVAAWIVARRLLWFLTPAIYISKPIFGTVGIMKSILIFFMDLIFGQQSDIQ